VSVVQIRPWAPNLFNGLGSFQSPFHEIAASIREFGWNDAVLVGGESGIIAAPGRAAVSRQASEIQVFGMSGGI
jgi:hypothetical protein